MKTCGGVDVQASALVRGAWSPSRPGRFTPGERAPPPGTHWIGGWNRDPNSYPSVFQPVASRYTD
jgi:hypothetical protein